MPIARTEKREPAPEPTPLMRTSLKIRFDDIGGGGHCTGGLPIFYSGKAEPTPRNTQYIEERKKQIGSLRDESQWIVAQRPLSHLQYPDTAGSSVQDFPSAHMDETQPRALQRAGGERLTSAEAFTSVPVCTRTRESPLQHGSPLRGVQLYSNRW